MDLMRKRCQLINVDVDESFQVLSLKLETLDRIVAVKITLGRLKLLQQHSTNMNYFTYTSHYFPAQEDMNSQGVAS